MEKKPKWHLISQVWLEDVGFLVLFLIIFVTVFFLPIVVSYVDNSYVLVNVALLILFFSGLFSGKGLAWSWILHVLFWGYVLLKLGRFWMGWDQFYIAELVIALVYTVILVILNLRLLFKDKEINFYRIVGGINVYLLVSIYGALFLLFLSQFIQPVLLGEVALSQTDEDFAIFMYYSMVSVTTVGFGELHAAEMIGKQLSVFLSSFGILYPAVVIAQLISKKK